MQTYAVREGEAHGSQALSPLPSKGAEHILLTPSSLSRLPPFLSLPSFLPCLYVCTSFHFCLCIFSFLFSFLPFLFLFLPEPKQPTILSISQNLELTERCHSLIIYLPFRVSITYDVSTGSGLDSGATEDNETLLPPRAELECLHSALSGHPYRANLKWADQTGPVIHPSHLPIMLCGPPCSEQCRRSCQLPRGRVSPSPHLPLRVPGVPSFRLQETEANSDLRLQNSTCSTTFRGVLTVMISMGLIL